MSEKRSVLPQFSELQSLIGGLTKFFCLVIQVSGINKFSDQVPSKPSDTLAFQSNSGVLQICPSSNMWKNLSIHILLYIHIHSMSN